MHYISDYELTKYQICDHGNENRNSNWISQNMNKEFDVMVSIRQLAKVE